METGESSRGSGGGARDGVHEGFLVILHIAVWRASRRAAPQQTIAKIDQHRGTRYAQARRPAGGSPRRWQPAATGIGGIIPDINVIILLFLCAQNLPCVFSLPFFPFDKIIAEPLPRNWMALQVATDQSSEGDS